MIRLAMFMVTMLALLTGLGASAGEKDDPVKADQDNLTGSWLSPVVKTGDTQMQRKLMIGQRGGSLLILKTSVNTTEGTGGRMIEGVETVGSVKLNGKKRSITFVRFPDKRFDVEYELNGDSVKLMGSVAGIDITGVWQREGAKKAAVVADDKAKRIKVTARASNTWEKTKPIQPFDLERPSLWNAGDGAPQWLEADLLKGTELVSIRLIADQTPAGATTHEIWVSNEPIGNDRAKAKLVHTFNGETKDFAELTFTFPKETTARYMQIHTTKSPSWVSWFIVDVRVR